MNALGLHEQKMCTQPWLVWLSGKSVTYVLKGPRFNSSPGHMPGLGVIPQLEVEEGGKCS